MIRAALIAALVAIPAAAQERLPDDAAFDSLRAYLDRSNAWNREFGRIMTPPPPVYQPPQSQVRPFPMIPPIGARRCVPTYVCGQDGLCQWIQACQ